MVNYDLAHFKGMVRWFFQLSRLWRHWHENLAGISTLRFTMRSDAACLIRSHVTALSVGLSIITAIVSCTVDNSKSVSSSGAACARSCWQCCCLGFRDPAASSGWSSSQKGILPGIWMRHRWRRFWWLSVRFVQRQMTLGWGDQAKISLTVWCLLLW